jgi:hypothetical protein
VHRRIRWSPCRQYAVRVEQRWLALRRHMLASSEYTQYDSICTRRLLSVHATPEAVNK